MNLKRFLLAASSVLLGLTAAASAQSIDRAVFSIGTTTTNAQGARWAYLLWQPTEHNALAGHKIAIYGKDGPADSANAFQRRAVTQRQTDPLVIQSLLTRAANLGDDLALLDTRINAMFAAAMPNTNLSLAQKISAVIRGAQNDPKLLGNIVFLGRVHPSLNMCLGHAWAEPLSGAGKATFEIRDFDVAANKDIGVFGRVTVDPLNPIVLPSPGMPVQFKEASPVDDLNIRLRWATPNPLREVGLLQHGFNLFRMNKAFALANNYHINPPTPTQLRGLLAVAGDNVRQINETPIIVNRIHDAASAVNFVVDPTYYIADDNGRYRFGGTNFVNGAEYYYFVSARDLLGRDGMLSPGGLAIACDRVPPDAPKGIVVENFYSFDPGSQATKQLLQVKWPQVPNTGDVVTAFYVYRWTNAVDATKVGQTNPILNRIAGPINYQPGQTFLTYIDNGAGSPQAPADYGKTFWYTVRAADAGACSNNLSANSSPVFGVLRDRTAPGAPTGDIGILCCQPGGRTDKDFLVTDSAQSDTNFAYYRFTVQRTNQALAFADFYYHNGAETNVIAHVPFPAGTGPLVYDWQFNRGLALGSTHRIFCKVVAKDGKESALILGSNDPLPPVGSRLSANWDAWLDCRRIRLVDSATGGRNECGPHTPINPNDGVGIEPPDIFFTPPATSKEFRLYRRVDGGPMTLIKQGPVTNDPPTEMQLQDPHPPANSAIVCYYVQCLDEHGNSGPLTQIADCFKFKLPSPKPLLSPLVAEGTESDPLMVVNWFCPPFGVERFELYIAMADGSEVPFNPIVSTNLTASSLAQPITKWVKLGDNWWPKKFYVYRTPRVGPQFGDGALFQVKVKAELNRKYIVFVKPVGLDGEPDPDSQNSRSEQFLWSAPKQVGPMVPWPERPLPNVATNSYPDYVGPIFINNTNATTNFVGVGLIIGATDKPSRRREGTTPARIAGNQDPMTYLATSQGGDEMMPIVVYRFQETNAYFPKVSGDIVQVSPMMERIAYSTVNDAQFGVNAFIYDPFIDVLSASQLDVPGTPAGVARNFIVLYDTQPVVLGSRYRYLIVRFGPNREIVEVIPTKTVEVL